MKEHNSFTIQKINIIINTSDKTIYSWYFKINVGWLV